ncbi:MAG TPA: PadR family transcriptional regulator [Thermoplasmata archaeon]|nr:PadR family transcriptional regulator [Thermoplasmata archaeon]
MFERKAVLGLVRVHVLHHATEPEGIYGMAMIDELARHGYRISPGTLYPILHEMEEEGILRSSGTVEGGRRRRVYRATAEGHRVLRRLRRFVRELHGEVVG